MAREVFLPTVGSRPPVGVRGSAGEKPSTKRKEMNHMEIFDSIIIGAGQAGLAMSASLRLRGIRHVVLERGVAERWRSERWDSFRPLSPNWQTRLPCHHYRGNDPDGFMTGARGRCPHGAICRRRAGPHWDRRLKGETCRRRLPGGHLWR
jgi:hypothetical protein